MIDTQYVRVNTLKGYEEVEDFYYVTKEGDVFSYAYDIPIKLKPHKTEKGYLRVKLSRSSFGMNRKQARVHRLVALAYIANPEDKAEVNHIDGDKENNHISNLEWARGIENINHSIENKQNHTREGYRNIFEEYTINTDIDTKLSNIIVEFKGDIQLVKDTSILNNIIKIKYRPIITEGQLKMYTYTDNTFIVIFDYNK